MSDLCRTVENIKRVAMAKGITQREIAIALEVSEITVSRWFKGTRIPNIVYVEQMEQFLGIYR